MTSSSVSSNSGYCDSTKTFSHQIELKQYTGGEITPLTEEELERLRDWNFNALDVESLHDKFRFVVAMFREVNLSAVLNVETEDFAMFLYNISLHYDSRTNPFHNFNHGITVAHGIYYMIKNGVVANLLDDVEKFALLFSALCHDVDHTGHSNTFEANSESFLFEMYGKASPLEKHHFAMTRRIVEACDLFKNLPEDVLTKVFSHVQENILATDMARHNDIMTEFKLNLPKYLASTDGKDLTVAEKHNLCGALVHAADIGAPTRDFEISKEWSLRISQEFTNQVKLEEESKIPVTPFYKGLDEYLQVTKNEIGFINFFIKPFWLEIKKFSEGKLNQVEDNLLNNIQSWQDEYQRELIKSSQQQTV